MVCLRVDTHRQAHRENGITERDRLDERGNSRWDSLLVSLVLLADHHHSAVNWAGRDTHATSRTTQSLRAIHNLHIVYGELTVLKLAPVKVGYVNMQKPFTLSLGEI